MFQFPLHNQIIENKESCVYTMMMYKLKETVIMNPNLRCEIRIKTLKSRIVSIHGLIPNQMIALSKFFGNK